MGLSEALSGIYAKIEDSFYGFLDFLEQKGLPVYSIVNPLEERGLPFFPVFVLALIILGVLAFGFVNTVSTPITAQLSLKDITGQGLIEVNVVAKDQGGKIIDLGSSSFRDGAVVDLAGYGVGQSITFTASKEGYSPIAPATVKLNAGINNVPLVLRKETSSIVGKLKLVEKDTGAPISNATVIASLNDASSITCDEESAGVYACIGVEQGQDVSIDVKSGSYEDSEFELQFRDGSIPDYELVPKANAAAGTSNLVMTIIDETSGQRIEGASIKVFDSQSNLLITEVVDDDGVYIEKISKGTGIRVVVAKDGYQQYDSGALNIVKILREDEEQFPVFLKTGGASVSVRVMDGQTPLSGAVVSLYNENNELVDSQETYFAGEVSFSNLNPEATYYATASMSTFLPARQAIVPAKDKSINLILQRANEGNSEVIEIFTSQNQTPVNNASLDFLEIVEEKELPVGIPQQTTDLSGKHSLNLPSGKEILVRAATAELEGENSLVVEEGGSNQLLIDMKKIKGIILLKMVDLQGKPLNAGHLRVESKAGGVLFDGSPDGNGTAYFDSEENDYVVVKYVDDLGKTFEEEVYVKGKEDIVIKAGLGEITGLTPTITFDGVFDVGGEKIEGIRIGQEYFLKFTVEFPEGEGTHGAHIRVGDDSVRFADSQDVGILGFAASNAQSFLGRSYSPLPNPGFEGIDFQNRGRAGSYNKFVELYFADGGKKVVKVRVKAKETSEASSFTVHYRAWSEFGSSIYRAPGDDSLQLEAYSDEKTGLYAEANKEEVNIFRTTSSCKEDLCASYNFVRKDGSVYPTTDFKPVGNEMYALEIEYQAAKQTGLSIKASTSKTDPKLYFQGYEIENFANFNDYNKTDTDIEVKSLTVGQNESMKARLYFKTNDTGTTSISLQSITQEQTITETFYFDVFLEKNLVVRTQPETVKLGQDFSFIVASEDTTKVENASIKLKRKTGELLLSIVGSGARDNGLNGVYKVKNAFDPGEILYEVTAPGFKPLAGNLEITKTDVLSIEPEVRIAIAKGQQAGTQTVLLENLSNESVDEVVVEVNKKGSFPVGMELKADTVMGIPANSSQNISFTGEYRGKAERAQGEAEVTIKGKVLGKYSVSTTTKVVIDYNPLLNEGDIEFSKDRLVLFLESGFEQRGFYDSQFSSSFQNTAPNNFGGIDNTLNANTEPYRYTQYSSAKTVEFTIKNNSNLDLTLLPEVIAASPNESEGITVELNEIRLKPAGTDEAGRRLDQQNVRVSVTNTLLRNYPDRANFKFDIFFKSDAVTKSIPLEVVIWHPRYALEVSRNIELYLATSNPSEPARATVPLFIRNVGLANIENISLDVSSASARGNVEIKVLDGFGRNATQIQLLQKGQAVLPPLVMVAESYRTEKSTAVDVKQIQVLGTIDGKVYQFGPIIVTSHISAAECLSVVPNSIDFISEKEEGSRSKKIQVKNTCAEPVRILAFEKEQFGGNRLFLDRPDLIIPPGSQMEVGAVLTVNERAAMQDAVFLKGLLVNSGRYISSNPINLEIKIGKEAVKTGEATQQVTLNVCNDKGEIIKDKKGLLYTIPKQAVNNNCEIAYCDAEQLAEFLAIKIDEKVKEAQRQITLYNNDARTANCSENGLRGNYCGFEGLGLTQQTFTVYFKHDNLTPAALEAAIRKKPSVGSYSVALEPLAKDVGLGLGLIGKKIVMNDTIAGCGRYRISISGAVKTQGQKFLGDFMNVLVNLHPDGTEAGALTREITEQCTAKIQNVMNFLPEDKGYTTDSAGTWLGMVDQGNEGYDEIGKEIAKGLFGNEQRFKAGGASGTNRLHLGIGTTQGYIVKLDMEKRDEVAPYTINAYVQEIAGNEQMQNRVAKESSQAINALKAGSFGEACISETEGTLYIKSASGLGNIQLSACIDQAKGEKEGGGKLSVAIGRTTCCEYSVAGNVQSNALVSHIEKKEIGGIKGIIIKGSQVTAIQSQNKIPTFSVPLAEKDQKSNLYISKMQLCVDGTETANTAHNEQIELNAKYEGDSKGPQTQIVTLQVCGTHPSDIIKAINDKKYAPKEGAETVLFATPVWKGNPERPGTISLNDLRNFSKTGKINEPAQPGQQGQQGLPLTIEEAKKKDERNALIAYAATCSTVSAGIGFWKGWVGVVGGPVFDCIVPALMAYYKDTPYASNFNNTVKAGWTAFLAFVKGDGFETPFNDALEQLEKAPRPGSDEQFDTLVLDAALSGTGYSAYYGDLKAGDTINPRNIDAFANRASDKLATEIVERNMPGVSQKAALISEVRESLREKIYQNLQGNMGTEFGKKVDGVKIADKIVSDSMQQYQAEFSDRIAGQLANSGKNLTGNSKTMFNDALNEASTEFGQAAAKAQDEIAKAATESFDAANIRGQLLYDRAGNISGRRLSRDALRQISDDATQISERIYQEMLSKNVQLPDSARKTKSLLRSQISKKLESKALEKLTVAQVPGTTFVDASSTIGKEAYEEAAKVATFSFRNQISEAAIGGSVDEKVAQKFMQRVAATTDNELVKEASSRSIFSRIRSGVKSAFSLQFVKSFGKSIFSGALANAAGLGAYKAYYKWWALTPEEDNVTGQRVNVTNQNGIPETEIVESDQFSFAKYDVIKIVLSNEYGKVRARFFSSGSEELRNALREPNKGKIVEVIDTCDGSFASVKPTALLPDPLTIPEFFENESAKFREDMRQFVTQYYDNYGPLIKSVAERHPNANDAILATLWNWSSNPAGTASTGCGNYTDPSQSFECGAKEIESITSGSPCGRIEETENGNYANLKCALQEYNNRHPSRDVKAGDKIPDEDMARLVNMYRFWNLNHWNAGATTAGAQELNTPIASTSLLKMRQRALNVATATPNATQTTPTNTAS